MPLVRIDLIRGPDPKQLRTLLDVVHQATVDAFGVPPIDRCEVFAQHELDPLGRDEGPGMPPTFAT